MSDPNHPLHPASYSLNSGRNGNVIKVVLLANGVGANPLTYRPNADESQWWNRRDALVRCVIAYLFCYKKRTLGDVDFCSLKELIIVFDEDWSTLSMRYVPQPRLQWVPSERAIIDVWKRATKNPGIFVEQNGLSCICATLESRTTTACNFSSFVHSQNDAMKSGSKRDLLDYLQATCSMEFLREHKLNSSVEVLIRKTNKTKLLEIQKEWERKDGKKRKVDAPSASASEDDSKLSTAALESIIQKVLQPESPKIEKVIAATLHESSQNELPCWDEDDDRSAPHSVQICFFLGAVRDMYKMENRTLRRVCDANAIPLLRIRLGPVSEFTSKILTVLAFHDSCQQMVPACFRLLRRCQEKMKPPSSVGTLANSKTTPSETTSFLVLHFLCHVPAPSHDVVPHLEDRNHWMWCMVRCIVTCLWRSRLASGKLSRNASHPDNDKTSLQNRLSFLFQDGVVLTLDQLDLVTDMATNHQAAPSEYQILSMVRVKLNDMIQSETPGTLHKKSVSELLNDLFSDRATRSFQQPSIWLDFTTESAMIEKHFYSTVSSEMNANHLLDRHTSQSSTLIAIAISLPLNVGSRTEALAAHSSLLLDVRKACVDDMTAKCSALDGCRFLSVDCMDREAVFITMIQHLAYQDRLLKLCKNSTVLQRKVDT